MQFAVIGSLGVLVLGSLAIAQTTERTAVDDRAIQRPFAEGGRVRLQLASGDYTLRAGADDRILVRWEVDDKARVKDVKELAVEVHVSGDVASVVTEGPTKHLHFVIELPARSDVHLRMRAGQVSLDGIDGHKDIRMTAGEMNIGVRPESLASAHASVTFGALEAPALGISKGGIKRSFDWIGGGAYRLDTRLGAGEITLDDME